MNQLRQKYDLATNNSDRLRIIIVLEKWLKTRRMGYDHFSEKALFEAMNDFIKHIECQGHTAFAQKLFTEFSKDLKARSGSVIPEKQLSSSLNTLVENVFSLEPEVIARQIALMDQAMFREIVPSEFLNQNWTKKQKDTLSPNIVRMIKHFNTFVNWIISTIVMYPDNKVMSSRANTFLEIMQESYKLNNFNAVKAISATMETTAIFKLVQCKVNPQLFPFKKNHFHF